MSGDRLRYERESKSRQKERILIFDMWRLLRGDEYQGVTPRNLKLFLTAVLGLSFPWMYREDEEEKMLDSTVGDAIRARFDEAKKRSTASAAAL